MFDKIIIQYLFVNLNFSVLVKNAICENLWMRDEKTETEIEQQKKNSKAKNFVHTTALWRDCVYYTFIHMYESHWMSENQSSFVSIFSLFFFLLSSRSRKCVMSIEKHHRLAFLVRVKILKSLVSV